MRLAESGSRGVFWREGPRGTQERKRPDKARERGDWWIRWTCPHGHLHRARVGPKALAQREAERRRIERPCPKRQPKPAHWILADVIDEYLDMAKGRKRTWKEDRAAVAFPNAEGNRDLRWAEKTFPAAVSAAEIGDFRLHDTRHTFASRLAMEGVDLLAIKALGGWKTLSMVQRYAHLSPGHQRSAIERLVTRERAIEPAEAGRTE